MKYALTISVGGCRRSILTVQENAKGDTFLFFQKSDFFHDASGMPHPALSHEKYTIHPSNQHESTNVITHEMFLGNRVWRGHHHTRAIKRHNGMSLLFTRSCKDLRSQRFEVKGNPKILSIGEYDPSTFILIYGISVSSQSLTSHNNIKEICFSGFDLQHIKLNVFYTFVPILSLPYSHAAFSYTMDQRKHPIFRGPTSGFSIDVCAALFLLNSIQVMSKTLEWLFTDPAINGAQYKNDIIFLSTVRSPVGIYNDAFHRYMADYMSSHPR